MGNLKDRLLYHFDYYFFDLSSGGQLLMLVFVTLMLTVVGGVIYWLVYPLGGLSFLNCLWASWTWVVDPGTHTAIDDNNVHRVVATFVSIGGIFFFALLIGVLSDGLTRRINSLAQGHSRVFEENHIIIIGFNNKLPCILKQMHNARLAQKVVVIFSTTPKEEMEEALEQISSEINFKLVFRQGDTTPENLEMMAVRKASIIVILSGLSKVADKRDILPLHACLTIFNLLEGVKARVICEVVDNANKEMYLAIGGQRMSVVVCEKIISKILIQCARQRGLANVLTQLIDFHNSDRDEFSLIPLPELTQPQQQAIINQRAHNERLPLLDSSMTIKGKDFQWSDRKFRDYSIGVMPDLVVCGIFREKDSRIFINPPEDEQVYSTDKLLVLGRDTKVSNTFWSTSLRKRRKRKKSHRKRNHVQGFSPVISPVVSPVVSDDESDEERSCGRKLTSVFMHVKPLEHLLFLGHRREINEMIREFDEYVAAGSTLTIIDDAHSKDLELSMGCSLVFNKEEQQRLLKNITVKHIHKRPTRFVLNQIDLESFNGIVIFSHKHAEYTQSVVKADAYAVVLVLFIKEYFASHTEKKMPRIIMEITDENTRTIVNSFNIDCEFVYSNQIVSMTLTQAISCGTLLNVYTELLSHQGSEIYFRDLTDTGLSFEGEEISFWKVAKRCRSERQETLLGFQKLGEATVTINPPKKEETFTCQKGDQALVLAYNQ